MRKLRRIIVGMIDAYSSTRVAVLLNVYIERRKLVYELTKHKWK